MDLKNFVLDWIREEKRLIKNKEEMSVFTYNLLGIHLSKYTTLCVEDIEYKLTFALLGDMFAFSSNKAKDNIDLLKQLSRKINRLSEKEILDIINS